MYRRPIFNFPVSILSKWLSKHKSSKVSFKFAIRKRHVNIDIGWPWIWNQYLYFGIWNYDRTKIIVLPSFMLDTRIYSQNRNETVSINVLWQIIWYMNIGISNWPNWSFDPTNMTFFILFQFLTRILTSKYLKIFSTYFVVQTEWCEKRAFQPLKMRKKKGWNIKSKCITDFLLTVRSSRMKDYTCHYKVNT